MTQQQTRERRRRIILGEKQVVEPQQRLQQRVLRKLAKQTVDPSGKYGVGVQEIPSHMFSPERKTYQTLLQEYSKKQQSKTPNRRGYLYQVPLEKKRRFFMIRNLKENVRPFNTFLLLNLLYDEDFINNMKQMYFHKQQNQVRFLKQSLLDFYFGFWQGNDVWIIQYENPIEGSVWVRPSVIETPHATLATTTSDEWSENENTMKFLKKLKRIATYKIPHS
jgi:hypothetical protein